MNTRSSSTRSGGMSGSSIAITCGTGTPWMCGSHLRPRPADLVGELSPAPLDAAGRIHQRAVQVEQDRVHQPGRHALTLTHAVIALDRTGRHGVGRRRCPSRCRPGSARRHRAQIPRRARALSPVQQPVQRPAGQLGEPSRRWGPEPSRRRPFRSRPRRRTGRWRTAAPASARRTVSDSVTLLLPPWVTASAARSSSATCGRNSRTSQSGGSSPSDGPVRGTDGQRHPHRQRSAARRPPGPARPPRTDRKLPKLT